MAVRGAKVGFKFHRPLKCHSEYNFRYMWRRDITVIAKDNFEDGVRVSVQYVDQLPSYWEFVSCEYGGIR